MSCLILQGTTILNPVVLDKQGGPNRQLGKQGGVLISGGGGGGGGGFWNIR